MLASSLIAVLSSLLLVNAQSPQVQVESIQAQFYNAYLVPDLLAGFYPLAYLTVSFNGNSIAPGTLLAVTGQSQLLPALRQARLALPLSVLIPTPKYHAV